MQRSNDAGVEFVIFNGRDHARFLAVVGQELIADRVSRHAITCGILEIGREGLGCEPASAVTLAGLKKLRADGKIRSNETVVLVLTGHTLKDADYTIDFHRGTLLTEKESVGREAEIEGLRRNAVVVDATAAAVLTAMKDMAG